MFVFLELAQVHKIHQRGLARHGGADGVRDHGLIESALASAENTVYYGNGDVWDVAAAYAFHLAEAQAFLDGNKRVGLASAMVFLAMNVPMRATTPADEDACYDAMIAISSHALDKAGLAALFRRLFG